MSKFLFGIALLTLLQGSLSASPKSPHIIILVADDLGWNDVGFHGSPQIPTPNIDLLGANGIILNNYYVSPICTPSRSALMTGMHPIHTGMQHDVIYSTEPWGLPLKFTLLPQRLKNLGYATHAVGKWHLGFFKKEYTPTHRGFDSHYGYWNGHNDYFDHTTQYSNYWGLDFRHNHSVVRNAAGKYSTELYGKHAVQLIKQHDPTKPLFLYMAYQAVHSANGYIPLQAPPEYIAKFSHIKDKNRRIFAAMVSALDDSIGEVLYALKSQGMLENSIVVFTTDNGGPAAGLNSNAASNWPLRGVKQTLWEGGVRGAALIWSTLLSHQAGTVSKQMMHVSDWLPTLYEAAGGNMTDLHNIDGVSMWSAFVKNLPSPRKEILHNIDPVWKVAAIRVNNYKLVQGTRDGGRWDGWYGPSGRNDTEGSGLKELVKSKTFRAFLRLKTQFQMPKHTPAEVFCGPPPANASTNCQPLKAPCLFDIEKDPCEQNNIADKFPKIVTSLMDKLEQYNKTAVPPGNKPPDSKAAPILHDYLWDTWM